MPKQCSDRQVSHWFSLFYAFLFCSFTVALLSASAPAQTTTSTPPVVTCVSAANYSPGSITHEGIVAAFGSQLATTTAVATNTNPGGRPVLPTTLAGVTVKVNELDAPLFFVSPGQINFAMPSSLPRNVSNPVTVQVRNGSTLVAQGTMTVQSFAPAFFTSDSSGRGIPSGIAIRVTPSNQQTWYSLSNYDSTARVWLPQPVDLNIGADRLFLSLFLSGIRYADDPNKDGNVNESVRVFVNGIEVIPQYAGAQPTLVGLDQLNLEIPRQLYGAPELRILIRAGGSDGNPSTRVLLRTPSLPSSLTWEARGLSGQTVTHLAAHQTVVLASSGVTLQRTQNNGRSWESLGLLLGTPQMITALSADPVFGHLTVAYGSFLKVTTDGGISFYDGASEVQTQSGTPPSVLSVVHTLHGSPLVPDSLVGTEQGLFVRTLRLVPRFPPIPTVPTEYIEVPYWTDFSPFDQLKVPVRALASDLVGTQGKGLYVFGRVGRGWQQVTQGIATNAQINQLAVSGQYAFATVEGKGLARSINYGATWQPVTNGLSATEVITAIAAYGNNVAVGTAANGIYVSSDNGETWRASNQGLGNLRNSLLGL